MMPITLGERPSVRLVAGVFALCILLSSAMSAQTANSAPPPSTTEKIIIDTDIGSDIDDAFAVGLALQSPEFKILGISTAWGDTHLRARLLTRFLKETGHSDIPIAMGIAKQRPGKPEILSQAPYAERIPADQKYPNAVDFLLEQIRLHPGEITLISIGPETNLGAAIDRDAATFRKLKRVVLMGGSVYRGYSQFNYGKTRGPDPEWNILCDIQAAQKVFSSGVPLYVMPLDSTQIKLQELERAEIFKTGSALADALLVLYTQWSHGTAQTPTLFDAIAVAYAMHPELCPTQPLRLRIDDQAFTRVESGPPNAQVCLRSSSDQFLEFFMPRIVSPGVITENVNERLLKFGRDKSANVSQIAERTAAR
ncbi:MAG: Inosine-uridine preferring nucleoside hydrolase [Candidatus Acidoferrum typicum]|nr:Inosine-uridine preferring nucleoside hydrolase [Candidatus Acidoferrum typicum]